MDEMTVSAALAEIEILLRRMMVLAERSALDDVTDSERAELQKRLEVLKVQLDRMADHLDAAQKERDAFFRQL